MIRRSLSSLLIFTTEWLVRERLRWAAQRLSESDIAIGDLARQLGYPDIFSFSRQFKQVHGVSPRAHRRWVAQ